MTIQSLAQTVSINRNSRELKNSVNNFLRTEWGWNSEDFTDGVSETRYSVTYEFINDNRAELNKDVEDFCKFIMSLKSKYPKLQTHKSKVNYC